MERCPHPRAFRQQIISQHLDMLFCLHIFVFIEFRCRTSFCNTNNLPSTFWQELESFMGWARLFCPLVFPIEELTSHCTNPYGNTLNGIQILKSFFQFRIGFDGAQLWKEGIGCLTRFEPIIWCILWRNQAKIETTKLSNKSKEKTRQSYKHKF